MIVCHKQCTLLWVGVIKNVSIILFGNSKQLYYNRFPYIAVYRLQSKKVFLKCIFITLHFRSQHYFMLQNVKLPGKKWQRKKHQNTFFKVTHYWIYGIIVCRPYFVQFISDVVKVFSSVNIFAKHGQNMDRPCNTICANANIVTRMEAVNMHGANTYTHKKLYLTFVFLWKGGMSIHLVSGLHSYNSVCIKIVKRFTCYILLVDYYAL